MRNAENETIYFIDPPVAVRVYESNLPELIRQAEAEQQLGATEAEQAAEVAAKSEEPSSAEALRAKAKQARSAFDAAMKAAGEFMRRH